MLATVDAGRAPLAALIDRLAHLLPAQGPISIFIHHNPLHACEDLPFEEAVEQAAGTLGCEPFLAETRYRDKLASGRILAKDVDAVLRDQLGDRGRVAVAGTGSRLDLWRVVVLHGIPAASGHELTWVLEETTALSRFRPDLPADARGARATAGDADARDTEERTVRRLWAACLNAVDRSPHLRTPAPLHLCTSAPLHPCTPAPLHLCTPPPRIDALIHPTLIRFIAGYLDQGLAHWPMPGRHLGVHGCFLELYRAPLVRWCGRWARALPRLVEDDRAACRDALASIEHSLADLGVPDAGRSAFLAAELLALRGWAGIVRQIEERPDRVPARDIRVTLRGYLAVRLLFERAALDAAARQIGFSGPLADLRRFLEPGIDRSRRPTHIERAWPLFHVAQLCGLDRAVVARWTPRHV